MGLLQTALRTDSTSTLLARALRSVPRTLARQRHRQRHRHHRALLALGALLLAATSQTTPASAQTLVSDADDYAPGETAYLAGTGFAPGETVGLSLRVETADDAVIDYAIGGVLADTTGEFVAAWLVPQEALNSTIQATAIGLSSGLLATTTFTDSHGTHNIRFATSGLVAGVGITITGTRTNPGHNPAPFSVSFASPGPSSNTGCQAGGSPVSFSGFPASVAGVGGDYQLNGISPASPFATGAAGGLTTVTATYVFVPTVTCPENNAPILSASPAELGQVVGCLDGSSFTATVRVTPADFSPIASDPDSDPVTVRLAGADPDGSLTLVLTGPGAAVATVTLIAEDDPSGRDQAGCDPLVSQSTSVPVEVRLAIVYDFRLLPPLTASGAGLFKRGSTIPIKFCLLDKNGTQIPPDALGLDEQKPSLETTIVSSLSPSGDAEAEDAGSSNDNGLLFRYDECWIYNLSTRDGCWTSGLMYRARIALNDGTVRDVYFSLKK